MLREQFGIEDPQRLYLSDTLPTATITYDTDWDRGEKYVVGSHRVGAMSVRRPGESWEQLERRLAQTSSLDFPVSTHTADASLASLDSVVRPLMESMLAAARRAGFKIKVTEARRTAERQAYLMTLGGNLTHTATSRHAEGYAVDVTVDDGDIRHAATREHWVAFRRWVDTTQRGVFRIIGTPDQSWDWPHIEYVGRLPGFGSLEELIDAARWCDAKGVTDCTRGGVRARGGIACVAPIAGLAFGGRQARYFPHDAPGSGSASLSRPRSRRRQVRDDGAPGRSPVPAGRIGRRRGHAGGPDPALAGPGDE